MPPAAQDPLSRCHGVRSIRRSMVSFPLMQTDSRADLVELWSLPPLPRVASWGRQAPKVGTLGRRRGRVPWEMGGGRNEVGS